MLFTKDLLFFGNESNIVSFQSKLRKHNVFSGTKTQIDFDIFWKTARILSATYVFNWFDLLYIFKKINNITQMFSN